MEIINIEKKPITMKPITKKCKECGERFTPKISTLEPVCATYDCRISFAMKHAKKQREKADKKVRKDNALEKSILKEKLKTLSDYKNDLQKEINVLVRQIDKGYPCIATGSFEGQMQSGHYASVGSNPTIRFHLENIWIQSMHSNSWKSGDTLRYQQGIIKLYGQDYLDYMNALQSTKPLKLTINEVKEKIPIVRSLIKWCKLQERKFTNEERIQLRRKFNNQIGIYL